jgi:hypothetical protein
MAGSIDNVLISKSTPVRYFFQPPRIATHTPAPTATAIATSIPTIIPSLMIVFSLHA